MKFQENPHLKTIPHTGNGVQKDKKGRFFHECLSYRPTAKVFLKLKNIRNAEKKKIKKDNFFVPHHNPQKFLESKKDGILRLGHTSFFIRIEGITILTDPVYYKIPLVRTISPFINPLPMLPRIDYLLISHDHRDHFDVRTLKKFAQLFPKTTVLTGLGMQDILKKVKLTDIQTAGWYQQYETKKKLSVYFLPALHRGRRTLLDTNKRLWGSFIIQTKKRTLFFGGDSGYEQHFKEIGKLFPDIDYALLGIGAYKPRWFMHPNHTSPGEALQAKKDLGAKCLIPMHFGVFELSFEPPREPIEMLQKEVLERDLRKKVKILEIGQHISL